MVLLLIKKPLGYLVQLLEIFRMSPHVRLSVGLCVCLSVRAFYLNTIGPISMKLGPHDLNKNLR